MRWTSYWHGVIVPLVTGTTLERTAMTLPTDELKNVIGEARSKWGWFVALGVLLLIFGGIAFGNLFIATVASVYFVGWLMLMAGAIEIIHAFGVKTWGRFFYWLLSGLLYAVAGFFAFYNPLLASTVFTQIGRAHV